MLDLLPLRWDYRPIYNAPEPAWGVTSLIIFCVHHLLPRPLDTKLIITLCHVGHNDKLSHECTFLYPIIHHSVLSIYGQTAVMSQQTITIKWTHILNKSHTCGIVANCAQKFQTFTVYSVSRFSDHFPQMAGNFKSIFTHQLHVPIYARLQIFIQLPQTLTKLCRTKHDYPVHLICSKCPPSAETHAFRRLRKSFIALLIVVCGKSSPICFFYNVDKHVGYDMTSTVT